ncbi:MAG TPA: hypothetical protein VFS66_06655 [Acidimicrobiia bacterium]|nr:hypothetical protein [Acidimicrobiia bacterium]
MKGRAGIAILALAVAACGAPGSSGAAPAPSPGEAPAEGTYQTVEDMRTDVQSAFILCNVPLKIYDPPVIEGALQQADCRSNVTMVIFEPADVLASAAALQAEADGPLALVVGTNWIISCPSNQNSCEKIQGVTGGELMVTP